MKEISTAKQQWDNFLSGLSVEQRKGLSGYEEQSKVVDLITYSRTGDYTSFDQVFNTLPNRYKYDGELIPEAYRCYIIRNLAEMAFAYINAAIDYYIETGMEVTPEMEAMKENAITDKLIEKVRSTVGELRNLRPADIPRVLPSIVNEKRRLSEFILEELVRGLKIMRKKIKAVTSIVNEDNFNDVMLATLRLRQQLWGWEISDQERSGPSGSGKGTGEVDITLKAGGSDIAIVEALKMKGKDFTNLQKHILKCVEYVRDLKYYYMVVYYYGPRKDFDAFCKTYAGDVAEVKYQEKWKYNATKGFIDLNATFIDAENIYIAKTLHGDKNYELFHILADMSS